MAILEISSITTAFMLAEADYVRLVERIAHFEQKGSRDIDPADWQAVEEAKAIRDALEAQMLEVLGAEIQRGMPKLTVLAEP